MIILLIVTVYGGYLFPLPRVVMSWREWVKTRSIPPRDSWSRIATILSLALLTLGMPLWVYAAFREIRDDYSYVFTSAQIGRWSSLALLVISLFAERKVRKYLLLGAVGLLFFFSVSIGELP
jgi:hypothetical protein